MDYQQPQGDSCVLLRPTFRRDLEGRTYRVTDTRIADAAQRRWYAKPIARLERDIENYRIGRLVNRESAIIDAPTTDAATDPKHNQLLAALPPDQWQRWLPHLEHVDMPLGQVLYEPGSTLRHAYFPTTAIVSLLYVMKNGESAEIAVVGNEGIVGVSLFMGGDSNSSRAVVQSAGGGFRLTAQVMKDEFYRGGPALHLLLRYTQALITQMVQTAACNRHHSLDQQLCRWLLLSLDRLQGTDMVMTQQLIANMMGVPLEGATTGVLKLQNAGLIDYTLGRIRVLDRQGLEKRSCECYAVVKREYDRLLPEQLAA